MVRRSLAESYIKFLVVNPIGYTNRMITDMLICAKLDPIGDWYLDRLRTILVAPVPFYPRDGKHKPSMKFLLAHGLHDFFYPDNAMREAFRLLETPKAKEWIEAMIYSNVPFEDIADQLTRLRGQRCTAEVAKRYKDMFCNTELLDSQELRELQDLRIATLADHPDKDIRKQAEVMKNNMHNDPLRAAANLPTSPVSALLVMLKMGVVPVGFNSHKVLTHTVDLIALRMHEAVSRNNKDDPSRLAALSSSLRSIGEYLKTTTSEEDEMKRQLQALAIRYEVAEAPTIKKLTGGHYTQNLEPERRPDELPSTSDSSGIEGEEPFE
jgi:hypothetical protein